MHVPANTARIIIIVVAVAAIVILMFVTGLADDKAPPGSGGGVPVTHTGTNDSPSSRWRRSPRRRSGRPYASASARQAGVCTAFEVTSAADEKRDGRPRLLLRR